jgi:hypothetical protein
VSANAATRAKLRALAEAPLSREEWLARSAIPIGPDELEQSLELIRWFCKRYPTPYERLAYVRRAYARWTR